MKSKNQESQECVQLLSFFDDFDDNNVRCTMPYFEILILAGATATFSHEAKWRAYERMPGGLRILSLAGATATFCAIINFRNPEF